MNEVCKVKVGYFQKKNKTKQLYPPLFLTTRKKQKSNETLTQVTRAVDTSEEIPTYVIFSYWTP